MRRETTLSPVINASTSLDVKPNIPLTELRAREVFYQRVAEGKAKAEYKEKAMDYRNVEPANWRPSKATIR